MISVMSTSMPLKLHQRRKPDVILVRRALPFGCGPPGADKLGPIPDREHRIGISAVNRQKHRAGLP